VKVYLKTKEISKNYKIKRRKTKKFRHQRLQLSCFFNPVRVNQKIQWFFYSIKFLKLSFLTIRTFQTNKTNAKHHSNGAKRTPQLQKDFNQLY